MARPDHVLVDTHTLIWWWLHDPVLPPRVRDRLVDPAVNVYVSAVSPLEIAIKQRRGGLPELRAAVADFEAALAADDFISLAVDHHHAVRAGAMQGAHRDPFDRLLAAQALIENLTLVTRDREIAAFGCETLW